MKLLLKYIDWELVSFKQIEDHEEYTTIEYDWYDPIIVDWEILDFNEVSFNQHYNNWLYILVWFEAYNINTNPVLYEDIRSYPFSIHTQESLDVYKESFSYVIWKIDEWTYVSTGMSDYENIKKMCFKWKYKYSDLIIFNNIQEAEEKWLIPHQ